MSLKTISKAKRPVTTAQSASVSRGTDASFSAKANARDHRLTYRLANPREIATPLIKSATRTSYPCRSL